MKAKRVRQAWRLKRKHFVEFYKFAEAVKKKGEWFVGGFLGEVWEQWHEKNKREQWHEKNKREQRHEKNKRVG